MSIIRHDFPFPVPGRCRRIEDEEYATKEYSAEELTTSTQPEVFLAEPSYTPEPRDPSDKHFQISMIKSAVRVVGYTALPFNLVAAALFLAGAEVLGILEEL